MVERLQPSRIKTFRMILLVALVVFSLGCNYVMRMVPGYSTVATGQALATEFDSGAFATQMQGLTTQMNPEIMTTQMGGMATEMAPLVTEFGAVITQFSTSPENAPPDIPIMEGEKTAFIASPQSVSYFTSTEFKQALEFYQREMPAKGWTLIESGTRLGESDAELLYEKDGRKAIVVLAGIPFVNQTTVVITLQ